MRPDPRPQPRRRHPRAVAPPTPGSAADARRADRSIVIVAAVMSIAGFALLMWAIADVVLLIFGGALMALFLRGLSRAVQHATGLSYPMALTIVLAVLLALIAVGGVFLGAETAEQLDQLGPRLSEAQHKIVDEMRRFQWGRAVLADRNLRALVPQNPEWLVRLGGLFSSTIGAITGFFILLFIGLYGAASPDTYREGLLSLIPHDNRSRAAEVLDEVLETLRGWLVGTVVKMTVVGVALTVGLSLLNIPLALALGLIAFVLEFAPYVGPILASIPALIVAFAVGPTEALYVALLYLGVQSLEGYVISPLIDQRSVHLPPAFTIAAQVLLGALLGVLGVIFATPLAATVVVLVRALYVDANEASEVAPGGGAT